VRCLRILLLAFALAANTAHGAGFGPPAGTLTSRPLPLTVPQGSLSPLLSSTLYKSRGETAIYYLGAGVGIPRLQIPDSAGATAWKVVTDSECAHLEPVPPAEVKAPSVEPVTVQHNPLPMTCAASFEGSCTSSDGRLRIATTFEGQQRRARVGGGFFGGEGRIDSTFYTGLRTLTIEHLPSRRLLRLQERLADTNGYSAPQTAIRYLPELRLVLLLGAAQERGVPLAHCIALPAG
jgi:hypothetical protein